MTVVRFKLVRGVFTLALLFACLSSPVTFAQSASAARTETSVPRLVQFNGTLKDASSHPVAGVVSVTFALYPEQDGGSPLWTETQNVFADASGHYNAILGTATSGGFPSELFSTVGGSRWLGVTVARQPEQPRVLLASVPYALKAGDAETLGGLPASSYVTTSQLAARAPVATPTTIVTTNGAVSSNAPLADGGAARAASQSDAQTPISGTGTANFLPLWTSESSLGNSKLFQSAGGFIGINTTTPLLQLDVNGNSIFRGSVQMAPQATATAVAGQPSRSIQLQGSVFNSSTNSAVNEAFAFRAVPDQNNTASPATKLDLFYGPGGGTLTDTGLSVDHEGTISFAPLQTFPRATGVLSNTDFVLPAVFISNSNPVAFGMEVDTPGSQAFAARFGSGYVGIYATGATYAAILDGDVQVTGMLSKAGGSFKIDDPIDPANKYLSHSFVESPDMMNVYNGNVTTDAKGFAVVKMPDWFEALNSDYRYQLTTMGQFAQAMVSKKIANGQFTIQTDKPNVEVSWQITGIRQDAWANAHRIPVEEDKSGSEKGHFLHPELFGHAQEPGIAAMRAGPDGKPSTVQKPNQAKK
jgi:hypothetical protein